MGVPQVEAGQRLCQGSNSVQARAKSRVPLDCPGQRSVVGGYVWGTFREWAAYAADVERCFVQFRVQQHAEGHLAFPGPAVHVLAGEPQSVGRRTECDDGEHEGQWLNSLEPSRPRTRAIVVNQIGGRPRQGSRRRADELQRDQVPARGVDLGARLRDPDDECLDDPTGESNGETNDREFPCGRLGVWFENALEAGRCELQPCAAKME